MKIKINKNILINNIRILNSLPFNFTSSPIIQSILIKADKDKVDFILTNGLTSIKVSIKENISILEEGNVLIKSKIFFSIISKLKDEEIIFEKIDSSVLKIKTSSFDSNLNILDDEQFPIINFNYDNWNCVELKSIIIKDVYSKLMQSVSINKERSSVFNGIFFNSDGKILNIVSSDTYKLSALNYVFENKVFKFIIDYQIINLINDNLHVADNIFFYFLENDLIIKFKNLLIATKLIEGEYPNVIPIINSPKLNKLSISKKEFLGALERGLIFSDSEKKPISKINFFKDNTEILFNSIELGNSMEKISNLFFNGNDLSILINAQFLISLLKVFLSDKINIETSTETKPIILTSDDEENFIQLVLPLRN